MKYTKTTFVDGTDQYLNASNMNKIGTAIEQLASTAFEPCTYSGASTSSTITLTTDTTAPSSSELPLAYSFIPTVATSSGANVQTSWSTNPIPIYDISTGAVALGGTIKANVPVTLIYDGTVMWVEGHGGGMFTLSTGNIPGTFDRTTTRPTGVTRLNYSGYLYATQMYADAYNSSATADIAEGYPVSGDYEPGDLIAIVGSEQYEVNDKPENHRILGVVSDEYAMLLGQDYGKCPVACAGRVHAKVAGTCQAGDYLVASTERGCLSIGRGDGIVIAQALADKTDHQTARLLVRICH